MRKLKSQIIYSSVRAGTVLNSNQVHSGGNWHRTASIPTHQAVRAVPLRLDVHFLLTTLRVRPLTLTHTPSRVETLRSLSDDSVLEQWVLLHSNERTPSGRLQLEVGNPFSAKEHVSFPGPGQPWWKHQLTFGLDAFRSAEAAVLTTLSMQDSWPCNVPALSRMTRHRRLHMVTTPC